jgi:2-phosphosulfolactate phosphatase
MNQIEVCLSTRIFDLYDPAGKVVVVVDVLRATSVICTMFHNGVKEIIPVRDVEEARRKKEEGYIVVAERDGKKLDFADFGNSPLYFTPETIGGKTIVYSTTNGTSAITIGRTADQVVIASFLNFPAIVKYLMEQKKDVLVLCSGWKGKFCIEDTLLAGAIAEELIRSGSYSSKCDSAHAAIDIWSLAQNDLTSYIEKAAQRHRLKKLGLDDVIGYCLTTNLTSVIPLYHNDRIVLASRDMF